MSTAADGVYRTPEHVMSQVFWVDPAYSILRGLGQGAYGCVAAAVHKASGEGVAIKKVSNIFAKSILTKRALREIKCVYLFFDARLLRHLRGHKNITCLYDLDITHPTSFQEVYVYEELMEADLHAIVRGFTYPDPLRPATH